MIRLFKHIIFKHILLAFLFLKVSYFVYDNVNSFNTTTSTDICCQIDFDDTESEGVDENEIIHLLSVNTTFKERYINVKKHFSVINSYRDFHFDFASPPPKAV